MKLPSDKENDKKMMRIPELLEILLTSFLGRVEDYEPESDGHDPAGDSWTGSKVRLEKSQDLTCGRCR